MRSIAIIPARSGSKRIPQKNIKNFLGEPIIAYSIRAAIESQLFDKVMVSTDSNEIAKIASDYGADVPFLRSAKTSDDYATTANVIDEVLWRYRKIGEIYDIYACIYSTAPFISKEILIAAYNLLKEADAVVPVVKYSFPPQRAFVIQNDMVTYQYPQYESARSQDLDPLYHDCGQFYFGKTDIFMKHKSMILPNTKAIILSEEQVQDIDTLSDWYIAESKYKVLYRSDG